MTPMTEHGDSGGSVEPRGLLSISFISLIPSHLIVTGSSVTECVDGVLKSGGIMLMGRLIWNGME